MASGFKGIEYHADLLCEEAQVIVQENCRVKLLTLFNTHTQTLLARFLI